jgi:transglutaminase-like putative cysteine protease
MILLFFTRLALYLTAFSLPVFHPGVVISYDVTGWWLFYVLIPAEMALAYFLSPPRLRLKSWLLVAGLLILFSIVLVSGFGPIALLFLGAGVFAFVSTILVFKTGGRGRTLATLEVFALGILYYKMLSFSRASEEVARQSSGIAQVILFLSIGAFLLHCLLMYFASFQGESFKRNRRELALFFGLIVPIGLLLALLLPPDFVKHSIVLNRLKEEPNPKLIPLDQYAEGLPGGNLLSDRRFGKENEGGQGTRDGEGEQNGEQGEAQLEGWPSDRWGEQEMGQGEGGQRRQRAVMVVASKMDPVYAAESYFGGFDPDRGFVYSNDEPLNELTYIRLLETWQDREYVSDERREAQEIFFFSTIPDRVLAYRPRSVEPTVLNRQFHPFNYSYTSVSDISTSSPYDWTMIPDLTAREREDLSEYLSIPLHEQDRQRFEGYLRGIVAQEQLYFEKISAILRSFSEYQYEIGFDDDVSVEKMEKFLFETKEGDCTEFSNTTAILARLAGIPARVVTGYLATEELQTTAHLRGLLVLQQAIEPLQQFPLSELYLVTTAHHHSWVQLYLPRYGWVDFESTTFAIPPMGSGDPNSMNVVIPIIQGDKGPLPIFQFPWRLALKVLVGLVLVGILGAYTLRYGREVYLFIVSKAQNTRALRALQEALLMRLAAEGYSVKVPSQTIQEYSESYPELGGFASLYTRLRYRERFEPGEKDRAWRDLRENFQRILGQSRKKGLKHLARRMFSLKGLYYL